MSAAVLTRRAALSGAVAAVAGMAAALAIVLHAAWVSPRKDVRPPRVAPAITLPRRRQDVARRIAVFVLTVPVAFAAAQWLAFGAQALARDHGWGDADAVVLMLFGQPVAWAVVMSIQMTRAGPVRMIAAPAVAGAVGTLLWSLS